MLSNTIIMTASEGKYIGKSSFKDKMKNFFNKAILIVKTIVAKIISFFGMLIKNTITFFKKAFNKFAKFFGYLKAKAKGESYVFGEAEEQKETSKEVSDPELDAEVIALCQSTVAQLGKEGATNHRSVKDIDGKERRYKIVDGVEIEYDIKGPDLHDVNIFMEAVSGAISAAKDPGSIPKGGVATFGHDHVEIYGSRETPDDYTAIKFISESLNKAHDMALKINTNRINEYFNEVSGKCFSVIKSDAEKIVNIYDKYAKKHNKAPGEILFTLSDKAKNLIKKRNKAFDTTLEELNMVSKVATQIGKLLEDSLIKVAKCPSVLKDKFKDNEKISTLLNNLEKNSSNIINKVVPKIKDILNVGKSLVSKAKKEIWGNEIVKKSRMIEPM